jgi:hypothetical protein
MKRSTRYALICTALLATPITSSAGSEAPVQCAAAPMTGCLQTTSTGATKLLLKDRTPDNGDLFVWKWHADSPADFGDPTGEDGYALCLYDESGDAPGLVFESLAPAGGTCAERPCWRPLGTIAFAYNDRNRSHGLEQVVLVGSVGSATISVRGKGETLGMPALPLKAPVTVQLQASTGKCFESSYHPSGLMRNNAAELRAIGD